MTSVAVLDVGSSSLRASLVDEELKIVASHDAPLRLLREGAASVVFDPMEMLELAEQLLERLDSSGKPDRLAITNQRASAIAFLRSRPEAIGVGISWEDLRTASQCLALSQTGASFAPNQSATKFSWLLEHYGAEHPDLMVGTIDTWLTYALTRGATLATDATNAAMTGLVDSSGRRWDPDKLELLGLTLDHLAPIVDVVFNRGDHLTKAGPVAVVVTIADQQASLAGQRPSAKVTLGTSAVADLDLDEDTPRFERRGQSGSFPIVTSAQAGRASFGLEAFWMNAGSAIAWLGRNGILEDPAESELIAATALREAIPTVVPAHSGIGAPLWDFGGRCVIANLSARSGRAELVHGFLLGISCSAADLIAALVSDSGQDLDLIGLDGKVATNPIVASALAAQSPAPLTLSPTAEATTLGAARLALGLEKEALPTGRLVEPSDTHLMTEYYGRYHKNLELAREAIPALSKVSF
ncbi:FGGY family carbohydrate kinase [Ferrimicrobium acidiphilum]|uniref:FGGY family carbohydrate kinase n=1 Tax=Ferrimicrobium acidiphilum TaxID=121039 RepID=UPI0023F1B6E3|nr:FGGY family carbohydrate kinase [Ferrimicrobium acidiphilum]